MELIFLRHGRTDWNDQGRLQGRTDVPLNEVGRAEAIAAGKVLKNYTFDAIYCSPLIRAKQTLELAYPTEKVVFDERLAEWSFGSYEGRCLPNEVFRTRWSFGMEPLGGMELVEDLVARVTDFYEEIRALHPTGRVLVVSHAGVSGAMHAAICGMKEGENLSNNCLPNATPVLFREGQAPVILKEDFRG